MKKKEVDRLHEIGAFTDEMYHELLRGTTVVDGKLNGIIPGGADTVYALKFNPNNFSLLDVVSHDHPWLGADSDFPDLFGKYGYTVVGIYDGFVWLHSDTITDEAREKGKKPIEEATSEELWMMFALIERYWRKTYQEWVEDYLYK